MWPCSAPTSNPVQHIPRAVAGQPPHPGHTTYNSSSMPVFIIEWASTRECWSGPPLCPQCVCSFAKSNYHYRSWLCMFPSIRHRIVRININIHPWSWTRRPGHTSSIPIVHWVSNILYQIMLWFLRTQNNRINPGKNKYPNERKGLMPNHTQHPFLCQLEVSSVSIN